MFNAGVLGVALVVSRRYEAARRAAFLDALRHDMAAIDMGLLNAELQRLSSTDVLTGLANRRYFQAELARIWQDRRLRGIGAALIDVDNFKSFNDSAGHAAGDACLQHVAGALSAALRQTTDRIARYGGEEFAVLLPGIPQAELAAMGERLRLAVADLALPHPGRPGSLVTVSVGLAWCAGPANLDRPELLLRQADRALYAAKAAGRNRSLVAAP
jgi:diguanylate cyclase (GGDEF)-like protein